MRQGLSLTAVGHATSIFSGDDICAVCRLRFVVSGGRDVSGVATPAPRVSVDRLEEFLARGDRKLRLRVVRGADLGAALQRV